MNYANHPLSVPQGLPNHFVVYWQIPQFLAIAIQISIILFFLKTQGEQQGKGVETYREHIQNISPLQKHVYFEKTK